MLSSRHLTNGPLAIICCTKIQSIVASPDYHISYRNSNRRRKPGLSYFIPKFKASSQARAIIFHTKIQSTATVVSFSAGRSSTDAECLKRPRLGSALASGVPIDRCLKVSASSRQTTGRASRVSHGGGRSRPDHTSMANPLKGSLAAGRWDAERCAWSENAADNVFVWGGNRRRKAGLSSVWKQLRRAGPSIWTCQYREEPTNKYNNNCTL